MEAGAVRWGAWRRRSAWTGLFVATLWFYLWTVSQGLPVRVDASDAHYPLLTDGFVAGQLSLPITPHPALLSRNAYDDFGNRPPYLHDASLYKGKYYLYFGVTPVVLLFLPFRVFGLGNLPESVAAAVFMFASVLFSLLTLAFLRRTEFPSIRKLPYEIYLMLALGGAIPYFLRRPAVYEVAIACGSFCVMVAIYCLVTLESDGRFSRVRAALASLFLGLAVGARPHLLMASPLLLLASGRIFHRQRRWPSLAEIAALVVPILLVGIALGWYNYARFDSWTEFGRWYQLAGEPVRHLRFDIRRVPFFSYLYLFHPGRVDLAFPYTHVRRPDLPNLGGVIVEPVTGVLYSTPILLVLAFLPLLLRSRRGGVAETTATGHRSAQMWACTFVGLAVVQLLFVATFPGATMRYLVDFSPLLMMAAAIVMLNIAVRLQGSRWRVPVKLAMVLLVGLTMFHNLGLGVRGYYDNLHEANPVAYYRLKSRCDRIIDAIVPWFYPKPLHLVSIRAPGGIERGTGTPSFWVGERRAEFELFARQDGFVALRTILAFHQGLKDVIDVRLTITSESGATTTLRTIGKQTEFIVLPVRPGHNRFVLHLDVPASLPAHLRPHVVLFDCKVMRFSKTHPPREL
jgi:hypothetical protein